MENSRVARKKAKKMFKKKRRRGIFLRLCFLFFLMIVFAFLCFYYIWDRHIEPWVSENVREGYRKAIQIDESDFLSHMPTIIYDKNGKELARLVSHEYEYLPSERMSPWIKQAFIAIEDQRFYSHNGIDWKAISRAAWELVKNKGEITQGGSTITQQLAKNVFLSPERSWERKIQEMVIALELEKKFTKDKILEFYVNNINYGHGNYSFESASRYYFGKSSNDLSLSQIAFLAAIPNNPSYYDPISHMEHTIQRRNLILKNMKMLGFITNQQYQQAIRENIRLQIKPRPKREETCAVNYAIADATKIIMEKEGFRFRYDFSNEEERKRYLREYQKRFKEVNRRIRDGGYRIFTSIDPKKQMVLQRAIDQELQRFQKKDKKTGIYQTQGAGVIIDNKNGTVVAIVGGRSQQGIENWFNRAYLAYRQPGSAIKPLVAYTPAFERGMSPYTKVKDRPDYKDPYFPKNAQRRHYGTVTIQFATEISLNTIPYQLVKEFSPRRVLEYLKSMEFSRIVKDDEQAAIALGGFTYGVTPLEMAGAYSTLARNGEFISPHTVTRILDVTGKEIYRNDFRKKRIYHSRSSYMMTKVLEGVLTKPYATGYGLALPNMPSAGKTGTTNNYKDGWFCGYTPYYTAVIWVGNDIPSPIRGLYGSSYPGRIWKKVMTDIHKGIPPKSFSMR